VSDLFTRIAARVLRPPSGPAPARPARFEGEGGVPESEPPRPRAAEAWPGLVDAEAGDLREESIEVVAPAAAGTMDGHAPAVGDSGRRSGAPEGKEPGPRGGADLPARPVRRKQSRPTGLAPAGEEGEAEEGGPLVWPAARGSDLRARGSAGWLPSPAAAPPAAPESARVAPAAPGAPGRAPRSGPGSRSGPEAPAGEPAPAALARPAARARLAPLPPPEPAAAGGRARGLGADGAAEPVVHVTIGRLEVRAAEPARPAPPRRSLAAPSVSLDDYLRRRREGRR
jgi:hypothetical protein